MFHCYCLVLLGSTRYLNAAFTLASGILGSKYGTVLLYRIQYWMAEALKSTAACSGCAHMAVYPRHMNRLLWLDMWIHVHIFESSKLKGLYIGDLLIDQQISLGKALSCHNKFVFCFFLCNAKVLATMWKKKNSLHNFCYMYVKANKTGPQQNLLHPLCCVCSTWASNRNPSSLFHLFSKNSEEV